MMMKSVFWWRKPEYPEETTDLRQVTDETFHQLLAVGRWFPPGTRERERERDCKKKSVILL